MTGSPEIEQRKGGRRAAGLVLIAALAAINAAPLAAQAGAGSSQLNAALRQLAARPGDLAALLSAGDASLALNDIAAAAGFYARAAAVAPTDRRVLLGTAQVALAQRRPLDALKAFAAAAAAGVPALEIAADRGLAYDLVGDTASAQELYRTALAARDDAALRRRLALSLAIAGDRNAFERALSPLLHNDDRAAFRTRAFGLAILGLTDEAVGIADAMMPTDLALRMAPYLRYMPRLTKAQQAAAANLGAFPAAADIGRDAPEIAAYASAGARIAARGDTSLTPSGVPLGTAAAGTARPDAKSSRPRKSEPVRVAAAPPPRPAPIPAPTPAPTPKPAPAPAPARTTELPAVGAATPHPVVVAVQSPPPAASQPAPPPAAARQDAPAESLPSVSEAFAEFGAPTGARGPAAPDAVDVARLAADRSVREAKAAADAKAAKAKADKLAAAKAAKDKADAAAKAKAEALAKEKAAKAEPARLWLQVGVGRNVPAFALDWKKLAKQADGALDGKGPWAIKYGATNRMLAGPYPTQAAQRAALKRLKDKGVDALPVSSEEGEKVTKAG